MTAAKDLRCSVSSYKTGTKTGMPCDNGLRGARDRWRGYVVVMRQGGRDRRTVAESHCVC